MVHAYKTGLNKRAKRINQYDLKGNLIKTWDSQREASNILKIQKSHICNCCKGKRKTAGRLHMEIHRHSIGCLFCMERRWLPLARNKTKGIFQGRL